MSQTHTRRRLWMYRSAAFAVVAVTIHLQAVWATPYLIMRVLMDGPMAREMNMQNQAAFPPPVSAKVRTVVMPSPDLLHSVCVYDLSARPVRISANPGLSFYWSIALYAANSDNFFVINDRAAAGNPVDVWLVSEDGKSIRVGSAAGSQLVVSPSTKGSLLMRVLTGDYEVEKSVVEPARPALVCRKLEEQ